MTALDSTAYLEQTRQPKLYAILITFTVLSTLAVILRFISRSIGSVGFRRDDVLILVGWAIFMCFIGIGIGDIVHSGLGLHEARVSEAMMESWAKYLLGFVYLYLLGTAFPKLSVLSLYLSIFTTQRVPRIICYVTGTLIICNVIAFAGATSALCIPLRAFWDPKVHGHCFDVNNLLRYLRFVNIVSDVVVLCFPIPHVIHLQAPKRLKVGLFITCAMGSCGLVASIISLFEFFTTNATTDNTWTGALLVIWAAVEIGMYLIAACMISYQPLVKYLWRMIYSRSKGSSGDGSLTGTGMEGSKTRWTHGKYRDQSSPGDEEAMELVSVEEVDSITRPPPAAKGIMVTSQITVE
ncbi:hypothetical protein ASPCADRAFT_210824 [Aspergillus carbonarius ITEM 5010]|uniref:Rhodopsin domain-containing protein n=1 Tax=Aspergillus carbonarius (strain ITEM 5010) TaxID=602072 RepID=A0A1R3RBT0_ASPC5|nr:hypothetical protein ASPCADRAFT_210824 [Aspergillus carbonarius ITEM 5010]